eukprot:scaffold38239_cov66-Phaeocystis_antarctica.AAC.6
MAPPLPEDTSVTLLSLNVEVRTRTSPPVTSRAPPLSAWLLSNVELCTARVPPLTSIAPPSRLSKTASEINTCPSEINNARAFVLASSRRRRLALAPPKRQPAITTAPPATRTCPSSTSPCNFTGGAPARTSSRVKALLEMKASLSATISSRASMRFASSTTPPMKCSPEDSLITTSMPVNRSAELKRASLIVL